MKAPEDIAAIIDQYNLADRDSMHDLGARIRHDLTIREVLFFADFLHGGTFTSSSKKWRRDLSGYVTQTHQEDSALTRLWEGLVRSAHFYIGAASVLRMQDARLVAGCAYADEGDGPSLYEYTIDALVHAVPKEYRRQLDATSKLDAIAAQGERIEKTAGEMAKGVKAAAKAGAKAGVESSLPKVYAKAANMSDAELLATTKPKRRKAGGGRKKEYDLDDAQVKAVLALMKQKRLESQRAYSASVIRDMKNGKGEYRNPYETPKDLDAAVRRYCARTGVPLGFKPRKRKWSAKL